jgi:type VI secretion system protein VasD
MSSRRIWGAWIACLVLVLALALAACAAKPPKPVETKAMLAASEDVNPDSTGRASPIVVRIYQLRGDTEFNNADFFTLYEKDKETLGASLIGRDEKTLFPGQQLEIDLPLSQEARFVGVVAAYRDLGTSRWRALMGRPEKSLLKVLATQRVYIRVGKDEVTLSAKN